MNIIDVTMSSLASFQAATSKWLLHYGARIMRTELKKQRTANAATQKYYSGIPATKAAQPEAASMLRHTKTRETREWASMQMPMQTPMQIVVDVDIRQQPDFAMSRKRALFTTIKAHDESPSPLMLGY